MMTNRTASNLTRYTATLVVLLLLVTSMSPAVCAADVPLTPVTLQLKWVHQFQFAGFYAAREKGYYRDEGLVVEMKERRPSMKVINEVMEGHAQFGVSNPEVLLDFFQGEPVVVLGAIFQHSPNVLLTRADSGITSPADLKGKRVMLLGSSAPAIWAMFASQDITEADLKLQQLTWRVDELINRDTDALSAYLTDQPFTMKEKGVPSNVIRPISYGIDFYGDCLITSQRLATANPELVERFARASFKGWEYAMTHTEEIIELILTKYNTEKTRKELHFEAEAMRELLLPKLVPAGSMNIKRWEHIAQVYRDLGMTDSTRPLNDFIYMTEVERTLKWLDDWENHIYALATAVILTLIALLLFNRRLKRGIQKRTTELDRNRKALRQVLDLVPNMVYAKNREGRFILANRAVAESLNTTVDELIGQSQLTLHQNKDQALRMMTDDEIVFDTNLPKVTLEEPYQHADGTNHWHQTTRLPFLSAETGEPAVLVLSVDITNRRQQDKALKISEEKFRAIFNQTYQFTGITEIDGTMTQTNQTSLDAFGFTEKDVMGMKFWDTPWWETADVSRDWVKDAVLRAALGETVRTETSMTAPNGERFSFDFSIKPARNDEGEIVFLIPEAHDITSIKKSEEELRTLNEELELRVANRTRNLEEAKSKLEESFEQLKHTQDELILSEKLAALGGLVAGVAHEINTPLGIGVTASSFLEDKIAEVSKKYDEDDLKRSDLEKFIGVSKESSKNILVNLNRAAELIKSFKQVAADQSSELPRQFNLKEYVDEVLLSLRPKYKRSRHTIINDCPDIDMFSYPGAFMQIITNLMLNSLTHAFDEDDAGTIRMSGQVDGEQLSFVFHDDGKGIPPELTDKVFEPFYTTKRGQGGTGLGLHIVFNTVTQTLEGSIQFESHPGVGTTYTITMPLTRKAPDNNRKESNGQQG